MAAVANLKTVGEKFRVEFSTPDGPSVLLVAELVTNGEINIDLVPGDLTCNKARVKKFCNGEVEELYDGSPDFVLSFEVS
jgi:hypothetical protein